MEEKEMTQIVNSAGEYLAPRVEVTRLSSRVMCASGGTINNMDATGDETTDDGF